VFGRLTKNKREMRLRVRRRGRRRIMRGSEMVSSHGRGRS
jgi:hypothetical protein